jgi:hypothetical protein
MSKYEDRYCAYVDILGFRDLVARLDKDDTQLLALQELLAKVHNPPETVVSSQPEADFRVQSISDAVALSAATNAEGLGAIIHSISRLAVDLLKQGFFIRGALVKNKLCHDDKMVFGKALVRAYELESTIVLHPRVMVTREVVEDLRGIRAADVDVLLRQSDDGPMYIHVLRAIELEMLPLNIPRDTRGRQISHPWFKGRLEPFVDIANQIQRRFDEATDNPRHFQKVQWFACYWNETVSNWGIAGFSRVKGPGTAQVLTLG